MKKKIIIFAVFLILITGGSLFFLLPKSKDYKKSLQFTKIEKGSIKTVVSCTGTINAKGTVDVGTQVSGTISKVYVDFNDKVKKGQILAKIDTTLLEIAVSQAEATVVKTTSQYEYDLNNYENYKTLHDQKLVSDTAFQETKVTKDASYASKINAETDLKKAKSNLSYAIIKSPIDGTVINRDVEEGQTVAASYSTPTLFTLAKDLSNMEIKALVDENDIGKIKVNQKSTFTVESYPEEEFSGSISQIRLEPTTVSNVVNYYVMINTKNNKNYLLPGMTATIDIIIQEKKDILLVQNTALKFKPSTDMLADMKKNFLKDQKNTNTTDKNSGIKKDRNSIMPPPAQTQLKDKNISELWTLDDNKNVKPVFIKTGITDGQKTEILENKNVKAGLSVIIGSSAETTTSTKSANNSKNMMGGPGAGGPPPMF